MSKIFISYKAEDRPRVVPLVAALEAEGFDLWWDQQISAGTEWRDEIERNLAAARCVVVVWSRRSVGPEGRFVRDEASRAQEAGVYLPIAIDQVRPPLGFGEVQALPLANWKGDRTDPRYRQLIDAIRGSLDAKTDVTPAAVESGAKPSRRGVLLGALALTGATTLGGGAWLLTRGKGATGKLAVMPFQNLSGDASQDYFAAGISEELRSALSRIGLSVIGRESTEAVKEQPIREAAERLDVSHLLSGSVRRGSGTVRVSTTLVDGSDGVNIWSRDYERADGDALVIQAAVAERVAEAMQLTVGEEISGAARLGGTQNAAALDAYLRAEDYVQRRGLSPATVTSYMDLMDQALAEDPEFVLALLGRARWTYFMAAGSTDPKAREAGKRSSQADFEKALKLAPDLPMAHARYAAFELSLLDFDKALASIAKPVVSKSMDPQVIRQAAFVQMFLGPPQDVLDATNRLPPLDPLSASVYHLQANALIFLGRDEQALKPAEKAVSLSPESVGIARTLQLAYILNGRAEEATRIYQRYSDDDEAKLHHGIMLARLGRTREAGDILGPIEAEPDEWTPYVIGRIRAASGQEHRAQESKQRQYRFH